MRRSQTCTKFLCSKYFVRGFAGNYDTMDMVVYDENDNDTTDMFIDKFFVGATNGTCWRGTAFILDFQLATEETFPELVMYINWTGIAHFIKQILSDLL